MRVVSRETGPSGAIIIAWDEGPAFFCAPHWTDRFVPDFFRVVPGIDLEPDLLDALSTADQAHRAEQKAIALLAMREQSSKTLKTKLKKRGFSDRVIDAVIERLVERRYLSDSRFASAWVRSRLKTNPEGEAGLARSLSLQGVDRETAREAILEAKAEGSIDVSFGIFLEKLARRKGLTPDKAFSACMRKGYPIKQSRDAIREIFREAPSEDDGIE